MRFIKTFRPKSNKSAYLKILNGIKLVLLYQVLKTKFKNNKQMNFIPIYFKNFFPFIKYTLHYKNIVAYSISHNKC